MASISIDLDTAPGLPAGIGSLVVDRSPPVSIAPVVADAGTAPRTIGLGEVVREGPRGPRGDPGDTLTLLAGESIMAGKAVTSDAAGRLVYADVSARSQHGRLMGLSLNSALAGGTVRVQQSGVMRYEGWRWEAGAPLYLGLGGEIVSDYRGLACCQPVGHAMSPIEVFVRIGRPVRRA